MSSKASWTWQWEVWYLLSRMGLAGVSVPAKADVGTGLSLCCFEPQTQSYLRRRVNLKPGLSLLLVRTLCKGLSLSAL